jgi:phosphoribosylformylglycinamidine synthase
MPLAELLDPQGKATKSGLIQLGIGSISDVRVGKRIALIVEAENEVAAESIARIAAEKLLANPIIESFTIERAHAV